MVSILSAESAKSKDKHQIWIMYHLTRVRVPSKKNAFKDGIFKFVHIASLTLYHKIPTFNDPKDGGFW